MKKTKRKKATGAGIALSRLFHAFVLEWREHVKKQIALHKTFRKGGRHLDSYLKQTIRIQRGFLSKIQKIGKKAKARK
jgi:hypothetical protein